MDNKIVDFLREIGEVSSKYGLYVIGGNIETQFDEIVAERLDYAGEYYCDIVEHE